MKKEVLNASKSGKTNGLPVNDCDHPQVVDLELDRLALGETVPVGKPYDSFQQQTLSDVLSHIRVMSGLCLNDFVNILEGGISRRCYIPGDQLVTVVKCCYDWQEDNATASVFGLLFKDLSLRPIHTSELVEIFSFCVEHFQPVFSSCDPSSLVPILLTLEYLEKALVTCQNSSKVGTKKFYNIIGNRGISQLVALAVQVVDHAHKLSLPGGGASLGPTLLARLQLLTCLGLCNCESETEREEVALSIAVPLSSRLDQLWSLNDRKMVVDSLPSDLVREKLLDIYLDKEYVLHSAAMQSKKTEQFSGCGSSLAKFCCVHLYRTPYLHSGELHNPSHFLYLLTSLLHSILSLKMGGPFLSCPQLECSNQMEMLLAEECLQMQETLKSHISYLVDRLSEDEITLSHLDDQKCWSYLMLLGSLPDVLDTQ